VRQALHLRIAAIGVSIMALTLAIAAVLTHELIVVGDRAAVDDILRQELSQVVLDLPPELQAAAGNDGVASPAEMDLAVQRFLAVHPGTDRHLTVITIGSRTLVTRDGPPDLERLQRRGDLPAGQPRSLMTVDSAAGPLRVLSASLMGADQELGSVTVVGPLSEGRQRAMDALVRIAISGAVGLVVGGLLLLIAVRRGLRPVRALAGAARSVDLTDLQSRVPDTARMDEVGLLALEFNRMLERIDRDEQQRRQLLSAVSHELRTPLAVARGHLELFETLGPADGASAADTAAVLRRELERLGRIVDDLTAVTRGDLGGGATAREPVFAPDVLADLSDRLLRDASTDISRNMGRDLRV